MYTNGTEEYSSKYMEQWAEIEGISVEELAKKNGLSLTEGKTEGSAETTPPMEPTKMAAGDSSSAVTSLESLETDPFETAKARLNDLKITKAEIDQWNAEANSEPEKKAIYQTSADGTRIATGEYYDSYVYDNYIPQAKREIAKEKGVDVSSVKEEEWIAKAKQIYVDNKKQASLEGKVKDIMEDFEDQYMDFGDYFKKHIGTTMSWLAKGMGSTIPGIADVMQVKADQIQGEGEAELESKRKELKAYYENISKENTEKYKESEKKLDGFAASIIESDKRLNALTDKAKYNPIGLTDSERSEYNSLLESRNATVELAKKEVEAISDVIDNAETLSEITDMVGRSYDNIEVFSNRVDATIDRTIAGLASFGAELTPDQIKKRVSGTDGANYEPLWGANITKSLKLGAEDLYAQAEALDARSRRRQSVTSVRNVEDFFDFGVDLFSEQLVNTAITASMPAAGLFVVSASAAGQKFHDMDIEIANGEKISAAQFYSAGLIYGAGEYLTEKVSLGQFKAMQKALGKSLKIGKIADKFDLDNLEGLTNFVPDVEGALKSWAWSTNKEGTAELASQLFSNAADKWVLGKDISMTEGLAESYLSGAVMSGLGFSAPGLAIDLHRAITTGPELRAAQDRAKEIISLKSKLDELNNNPSPTQETNDAKNRIQERIDELAMENVNAFVSNANRIDELSRSDKRQLLDIDAKSYRFKSAIEKVNNNTELSKEEKLRLIERYANGLDMLQDQKDRILGNAESSRAKASAKILQMKLVAANNLKFTYLNGKNADDVVNQALEVIDNSDLDDNAKAALKAKVIEAKGEEGMNGFYIGAEEGLPLSLTTDEGAKRNSSVAAHEVSHATLFRKLVESNADMVGLANDMEQYMTANYGAIAKAKFAKVNATYTKEAGFTEAQIAEEKMAAAVELARKYDLESNKHKTLHGKLLSRWNSMTKGDKPVTEIRNGKDVLNAIISFNSSFDKGDIDGLFADIISGKVKVSNERLQKSADAAKTTKAAFSISAAAQKAKDVLAKVSANMDFFDPNSPLIARVLPGMIDAQASVYKAKGLKFDMQELNAEVLLRLYEAGDIAKFDGRGELYGYLNQRIKFRILDAFKQNPDIVENFAETDIEGLEGKAVQKVAVEPIEETTAAPEKPKYRSLLDAKVVSVEGLETVKQKVMSTVRVMKKRMDESVSKNVTVKPYIAELKKDFGKQIDIILKKEMGTVKDRALQKWLLKNKKAILENMTTTWLMTAMPNAVQKKVDGQWTSDWKGKKIDRETVSTDNAGRTSGAELVRRLPKASLNMSDADFLSNLFDEKGSLIRGRKESLAKAIAEEVGFEVFNQELADETSPIREAFEQRQDLLNVELAESYVVEVARDIERGNVKFSITPEVMRSKKFISLVGAVARKVTTKGIDGIIDDNNELTDFAKAKLDLPNEWSAPIAQLILQAHEEGIIQDEPAVTFMVGVKASELIPESEKPKKALTKRSPKAELDVYADEVSILGKLLGTQVMSAWDVQGLGFFNRLLDPAKTKKDTGKPGAYYNKMMSMLSSLKATFIPSDIKLSAVSLMNKGKGLMKEVAKIQDMDISKAEKINLYNESGLAEKITEANTANKKLAKHIIKTAILTVKAGDISGKTYIQMLQAQTNAVNGLRALSGLTFITFKDGPQGNMKGEHLADNASTMLELSELPFAELSEGGLNTRLDDIFDAHDQWIENRETLDYVDAFGKNNPNKERRILTLPASELADVYHYSGRPAVDVIDEITSARNKKKALFSKTSPDKLNSAKETFNESVKGSQSTPRAVFMVGGPGAGKTNVGKGLKLGRRGYKVINQDIAVEALKEEANLPAREGEYTTEQRSLRSKIGAAARKAAQEKMEKYTNNRESMVVDGTGASFNATMKKIKALEDAGYEVHLVFANTSLEEAVARNEARAERSLPQFVVEKSWAQVQESAAKYKEIYGERFYEVNTNELKIGEDLPKPLLDKLYKNLEVGPAKYSKTLSKEFNEIIERRFGVGAEKVFSKVQAELRGSKKGRFKFFIAPGADDFRGLVHYAFAGKGKQGEADMAWFEEKLMDPYFKGVEAINRVRQQIKRDFKETIKTFRKEYKMLGKKIGDTGFTYDQALRVYMWNRQGTQVPGLSKRDTRLLLDAINKNPELVALADALLVVSRRTEWMEPGDYWQTQTVLSDLNGMTEKIGRKKYLAEFIENADIIFTEENLNKIEAIKGRAHREALEDALYAMRNGSNRPTGSNKQVNAFINWINGSTGAIMFFNRRSALLQMLSFTNFINWSDNNPAKAAAAFANQKQYWADWAMIFNSDKLKERRSGLKTDVSESELANAANRSKGDPRAILAYLLKIGFTPTQIADSMAIATGGATFYRNRVNKYVKEGMSVKDAEAQAFIDFAKKSDEAQQSSDPALVSQLQRSVLGRLVFAFANTPMQYTRLMKKAAMDLAAGRGSFTENVSKIAYYGVVQNFIFSSLQSALFALIPGFDDEDEELDDEAAEKLAKREEAKIARVLNSMIDTIVRGSGVYGAIGVTIKNTILEYLKQEEKGFLADHTYTVLSATSISPPINSKLRKIYSATQTKKFERDELEVRPWAIATDGRPNFGPGWSIVGNLVSGTLNVPLDRVVDELNSIGEAMDKRNTTWQRIALALGWKTWDVNAKDEEGDIIKAEGKAKRKKEGIEKAKQTRAATQEKKKKEKTNELDAQLDKISDKLMQQRMPK